MTNRCIQDLKNLMLISQGHRRFFLIRSHKVLRQVCKWWCSVNFKICHNYKNVAFELKYFGFWKFIFFMKVVDQKLAHIFKILSRNLETKLWSRNKTICNQKSTHWQDFWTNPNAWSYIKHNFAQGVRQTGLFTRRLLNFWISIVTTSM